MLYSLNRPGLCYVYELNLYSAKHDPDITSKLFKVFTAFGGNAYNNTERKYLIQVLCGRSWTLRACAIAVFSSHYSVATRGQDGV